MSEPSPALSDWRREETREREGLDWLRESLTWKQPSAMRPRWELWIEGAAIGVLERQGFLARHWEASGPSGRWELRRDWRGRRWIGRPGASLAAVRYRPWWRGGRLELADATRLVWRRVSLWRREWVIANEEGFPFVTFRARLRKLGLEGSVEFDASARRLTGHEPLVLLGWSLILDARRKAHAH